MKQEDKQKFLKAKNKSWLVAKLIISKKKNSVWNLSENIRISNQLKTYEKNDIDVLSILYEYLLSVDSIPQGVTIYKLILLAKESVVNNKFTDKVQRTPVIDLMKYL